jgi:hypothetical protein
VSNIRAAINLFGSDVLCGVTAYFCENQAGDVHVSIPYI